MIAWEKIHTVLLDMDGTLLDLHYDNHFWLEHVPRRYAEKNALSLRGRQKRASRAVIKTPKARSTGIASITGHASSGSTSRSSRKR